MADINIANLEKELSQRLTDIEKMEAERTKVTNKKTTDLQKAAEKRDHDI